MPLTRARQMPTSAGWCGISGQAPCTRIGALLPPGKIFDFVILRSFLENPPSQTDVLGRIRITMYRLFVAIDLPDQVKKSLTEICFGLAGAKWVE